MITPTYSPTATERVLPRLALDFTTGVLDSRVTVTRALNTATRVNSSGLIEIVNADLPRFDYDPITLAAKGLLIEETRANLVLQSSDFATTWNAGTTNVSTDTTVAPDGATTADTVTATVTSSFISQNITFTGDGNKTISVFLKAGTSGTSIIQVRDNTASAGRGAATITWTNGIPSAVASSGGTIQGIDAYANGFYRIKLLLAGVVAANTNSFRIQPDSVNGNGSVILWGAQAENGAFSTSYIPTTTTSLTRNSDVVEMTGTNFSSWYNTSEGTFAVNFGAVASAASLPTLICASDSPLTNDWVLIYISATNVLNRVRVTGVDQGSINVASTPANGGTAVLTYKQDSFAASFNGGTPGTDTSGTVPTDIVKLWIGTFDGTKTVPAFLNGCIKSIRYWPQRVINAETQAFSK